MPDLKFYAEYFYRARPVLVNGLAPNWYREESRSGKPENFMLDKSASDMGAGQKHQPHEGRANPVHLPPGKAGRPGV